MRPVAHECNGIVIVESLRADERDTAERLHQTLASSAASDGRYHGLFLRRKHVGTQDELFRELAAVRDQCALPRPPLRPILHFEIHGAESGMQLHPSGEFVPWGSLYQSLCDINRATEGQLEITLGTCKGAYIIDNVNAPDPAPFWGVLAPLENVTNLTIESFFATYYETLLETRDGSEALTRAREDFVGGLPEFQYITSREIFVTAVADLLAESWTEAGQDRLIEMALMRDDADPYATLDVGRRIRARRKIPEIIESRFLEDRQAFFMKGCDAQGRHLSGVEWDDVIEIAQRRSQPRG